MADHDADLSLDSLLGQIQFYLAAPLDFASTSTTHQLTKVRLLAAAATYFNTLVIMRFGGRGGAARAPGLVEQVIAAAFQSYGDEDPHPSHFEKAAILLRGITQGHPFNDGNKRTGFALAAYYLQHVGYPRPARMDVDAVVAFCLAVSAGEVRDVAQIAASLRQLWQVHDA